MTSLQPNTHTFIVKMWLEEAAWRGRITHMPSGNVRYFTTVHELSSFVLPYLHELGAKPTLSWRMQQWVCRWKIW